MLSEIKKEILYSKEISNLIYSGAVDLICFGGSRALSLDTPQSDYDICILLNKPIDIDTNNFIPLEIPSKVHVHYKVTTISDLLSNIEKRYSIDAKHYWNLLCLCLLNEDLLIYKSPLIQNFLDTVNKYFKPLFILSLEKLLENCYTWLNAKRPFKRYYKAMYHYLSFYYLLNNYIRNNSIEYTYNQKLSLLTIKETKQTPKDFLKLYTSTNSLDKYSCIYNYKSIIKELINSYGKIY